MRKFQAIEAPLIESLVGCLRQRNVEDANPFTLTNSALLSSTWQKAIRRGSEDLARASALALWKLDRSYVWRRIRSIAMEDVSVANLELVAQVLAISSKTALRERIGDQRVLAHLTTMLARSPKCRTACELLVWRSDSAYTGASAAGHASCDVWEGVSNVEKLARVVDSWILTEEHSVRRAGTWVRLSKASMERRQRNLDAIGASELVQYVAMKGGRTDRLNTLVPVVEPLMRKAATVIADEQVSRVQPESINGYPDFSFCLFSKPGREALRRMLRSTDWGARLSSLGVTNLVGALGSLVFYVEGALCLTAVQVAYGRPIQRLSRVTQLNGLGIPVGSVDELLEDMRLDMPLVNRYRRQVHVAGSEGVS